MMSEERPAVADALRLLNQCMEAIGEAQKLVSLCLTRAMAAEARASLWQTVQLSEDGDLYDYLEEETENDPDPQGVHVSSGLSRAYVPSQEALRRIQRAYDHNLTELPLKLRMTNLRLEDLGGAPCTIEMNYGPEQPVSEAVAVYDSGALVLLIPDEAPTARLMSLDRGLLPGVSLGDVVPVRLRDQEAGLDHTLQMECVAMSDAILTLARKLEEPVTVDEALEAMVKEPPAVRWDGLRFNFVPLDPHTQEEIERAFGAVYDLSAPPKCKPLPAVHDPNDPNRRRR